MHIDALIADEAPIIGKKKEIKQTESTKMAKITNPIKILKYARIEKCIYIYE